MVLHAQVCGRVGSRPVYSAQSPVFGPGFFVSFSTLLISWVCSPPRCGVIVGSRLISFRESGRVFRATAPSSRLRFLPDAPAFKLSGGLSEEHLRGQPRF